MDAVNEQVARELELIPRGDLNQNLLRMNFQMLRANALGANADQSLTAAEALARAVAMVRQNDAAFEPRFDAALTATPHTA
jgi:hypothetical protein